VRDIIFDAFGVYFTVEQLSANHLRIRLSPTEPDANEQHWSEEAREFHRGGRPVGQAAYKKRIRHACDR
jgi:hypothetical protein